MKSPDIATIIRKKSSCYFISPHFDDAAFSAGGLMGELAAAGVPVTVINVFTSCGDGKNTLSAKKYLTSVGATTAEKLYEERSEEDAKALKNIGVNVVNLGFTEALWRNADKPGVISKIFRNIFPEFSKAYPVYRLHVIKTGLNDNEDKLAVQISHAIGRIIGTSSGIVFGPIGCGGHVDHNIVREACINLLRSHAVHLWADMPYVQKTKIPLAINHGHLNPWQHEFAGADKLLLCQAYSTQYGQVISDHTLPYFPEFYFALDRTYTPNSSDYFLVTKYEQLVKTTHAIPDSIGKYRLEKIKTVIGSDNNYLYGIYMEDGSRNRSFAKLAMGSNYSISSRGLANEILAYKTLPIDHDNAHQSKQHLLSVKTPRYIDSIETSEIQALLLSYIKGSHIGNIPTSQKIRMIESVLLHMKTINTKLGKKIHNAKQRNMLYYLFAFPIILSRAIWRYPEYFFLFLKSMLRFYSSIPFIRHNPYVFVHRDISYDNIINTQDALYLIDFQQAVMTYELAEYVSVLMGTITDAPLRNALVRSNIFRSVLSSSNTQNAFSALCIFYLLFDLKPRDTDDFREAISLLNQINTQNFI
jgi:LmbE family N-acetylglucosaminyl deacetylase/thiamine kinase-like enzyme